MIPRAIFVTKKPMTVDTTGSVVVFGDDLKIQSSAFNSTEIPSYLILDKELGTIDPNIEDRTDWKYIPDFPELGGDGTVSNPGS